MSGLWQVRFRWEGGSANRSLIPLSPHAAAPWHFLYFFPLPQGQGSLRPTFGSSRRTVLITSSPPVRAGTGACLAEAEADTAERAAPAKAGTASPPGSFMVIGIARLATGRGAAGASSLRTGRSRMT